MSELGLPQMAGSTAPKRQRTYYEYTLDAEMVDPEFFEKFVEKDLTFAMTEPRPAQMEHAGKIGGNNSILLAKEMLFQALYKIGDWNPASSRDVTGGKGTDAWWDLIGARCRDMINREFVDMIQPSEDQVLKFQATRKIVKG